MRTIREAKPTDITSIMQVMEAAKRIMRQSGNIHQWGDGYPSEEVIFNDMEKHGGFVIEDEGRVSQPTQRYMTVSGQMMPFRIM